MPVLCDAGWSCSENHARLKLGGGEHFLGLPTVTKMLTLTLQLLSSIKTQNKDEKKMLPGSLLQEHIPMQQLRKYMNKRN